MVGLRILQKTTAIIALAMLAAVPATKPVVGVDTSIAKDQYHFPAPPGWTAVKPDPDADSIIFLNSVHDGQIQLLLLPKEASVDPDIAMNVAVAVVKQLKQTHEQNHDEMILQPKILKDKRFAFCVHEKYKVGDNVMDRLHIYKALGSRVLLLTVNSLAKDPDKITEFQNAGEQMLDSTKFNRKAFKKDQ